MLDDGLADELPKKRPRIGSHAHCESLLGQLESIAEVLDSMVLSGEELKALLAQSAKLHSVLQRRERQAQAALYKFEAAPCGLQSFSCVGDLCAITDFLNDIADAPCVLLTCKAMNRAIRNGEARSAQLLECKGVATLIETYSGWQLSRLVTSQSLLDWWLSWGLADGGSNICDALALGGCLSLLQEARRRQLPWGKNAALWAASSGHVALLEWAAANGCPWDPVVVCEFAASMEFAETTGGLEALRQRNEQSLAILRWALTTSGRYCADLSQSEGTGASVGGILERAVKAGNVLAIRWLHANGGWVGFDVGRMWSNALKAPEEAVLDVVHCLHELGLPWAVEVCAAAAGPERGTYHNRKIRYATSERLSSNLRVLQHLRGHGCPWNEHTCAAAARAGSLETLRYARQEGCAWDARTIAGVLSMLGGEYEHAGHREVLRWALDQGCPVDQKATIEAACIGDIDLLTMLVGVEVPLTAMCCAAAAWGGHLDCLQWLRARGCAWDESTWLAAADPTGGQLLLELDSASWEHEIQSHGGPHLQILQYLLEEDCPCAPDVAWHLLDKLLACNWVENPAQGQKRFANLRQGE